jgi:pimeloyl-ACP methyl ester carboxylesterase
MHPSFAKAGHRLLTPTYTGLGERAHLVHKGIDLGSHIDDICAVAETEDLRDFVLIGHSYGGMVATGVADRIPDRIRRIVYLDAFVPRDGQSLADLVGETAWSGMRARIAEGDGWRVPPNPTPPDTSPTDAAWLGARRMPQPAACFEQKLKLRNGETRIPRTYVYCLKTAPHDPFRQFATRAKSSPGWRYHEIDASHSPHVTTPDALMELLLGEL